MEGILLNVLMLMLISSLIYPFLVVHDHDWPNQNLIIDEHTDACIAVKGISEFFEGEEDESLHVGFLLTRDAFMPFEEDGELTLRKDDYTIHIRGRFPIKRKAKLGINVPIVKKIKSKL